MEKYVNDVMFRISEQKRNDMDNRREEQEVLMAIQSLGKLGAFMDPFFKLTAVGTILLFQHFYRMYREGKLSRKEFQSIQEFPN